ncbi:apolipoprotein A-I-like [Salvelinus namaycush]|uniref:Apolipoprotein A-I-like n=1 Tax=Salvelinus namaycush TaxID=8040 RepID=A0A8U0QWP3_SALNM|nr:apolipoprotein A-I-like [Salvelinus namaycush]
MFSLSGSENEYEALVSTIYTAWLWPDRHTDRLNTQRYTKKKTVRNANMKVLAVLAIAILSGCHANLFYADEPKPQLEQLTDAFWDYVAKATKTADDTVQMIRKSQLGQDVNDRITESADVASQYAISLQEQLPPAAKDLMTKITQEAEVLKERLEQDLGSVKGKLEPYAEEMKTQVQQRVEQLKQDLAPYAESLDSEALRATLLQKSEELKGSLEQSVKEMQSQLGPYTDELKQKVDLRLQDFQKRVAPLAENLQSELATRAQMVQKSLAPYAEDLKDKLDPYAQDLKAQLTALYQAFTNTN